MILSIGLKRGATTWWSSAPSPADEAQRRAQGTPGGGTGGGTGGGAGGGTGGGGPSTSLGSGNVGGLERRLPPPREGLNGAASVESVRSAGSDGGLRTERRMFTDYEDSEYRELAVARQESGGDSTYVPHSPHSPQAGGGGGAASVVRGGMLVGGTAMGLSVGREGGPPSPVAPRRYLNK